VGTAYGEQKSFTTNQEMPTVITGDVINITYTTADCSGNVTADGGASVTARGVCWSTSENPTTLNSMTTDGTGVGTYTSNITGLSPNTTYYVRAYATNTKGTAYGEQKSFRTYDQEMPTVFTGDVTNITATTTDCSGNVTADGGASVTARGVCWSTSENPTTSNSMTTDGTGVGTYSSNITGLSPNTTYYVRAYATNSVGTAYGEQKSFTTNLEMPSVITGELTNITTITADCSGNVTADGGASVTARGVCWSTSENPTTSNSMTTNGTGVGTYTSNITGLSPNTTYYVRAYATNTKGTAYGEQKSFRTYDIFLTDSRDGHIYKTVTIGSQVWMAENLAYLPYVVGPGSESEIIPYYYVYGYDGTDEAEAKAYEHTPTGDEYSPGGAPIKSYETYGVLYNWPAAMSACPEGWHLPSDVEWTTLADYLGGESVAGGKMKEAGTSHWKSPNEGATNSSGFTGLPGGGRDSYFDAFSGIGGWCELWSSTLHPSRSNVALIRYLRFDDDVVPISDNSKSLGYSVRCIGD